MDDFASGSSHCAGPSPSLFFRSNGKTSIPDWDLFVSTQRLKNQTRFVARKERVGDISSMKRLVHNGILVPKIPDATGMTLQIRGQGITLDSVQEQMAMQFAAKRHLGYWEDSVFVRNFLKDFSKTLGIKPALKPTEVDLETLFRPAVQRREAEQALKEAMTKEEKKALREDRKAHRESLREQYGFAEIDGERIELANWTAEPSCIFMGRGQHPLRGRWKPGPRQSDITLNLDPKAPMPLGDWAGRLWQSESLWVARWIDRLSGKMKYVWVSDTAAIKQDREAQKFAVAHQLERRISRVRKQIWEAMGDSDARRRQIACASYLIDVLSLRVGDEKNADEADTVGATTLRPEHVTIKDTGEVEFQFLGKDSVPWHKTVQLPPEVITQLQALIDNARAPRANQTGQSRHPSRVKPQIFPDVRSRNVNAFLNEIMSGLTAKVFRTYHASSTVRGYLQKTRVSAEDPAYLKKYYAKRANLEAAIVCNHTKQEPAGWPQRAKRFRESRRRADERIAKAQANLKTRIERLKELLAKQQRALDKLKAQEKPIPRGANRPYASSIASARRSVETAKTRLTKAKLAKDRFLKQLEMAKKTRTWNLGTSLKSYIDPRIYRDWGRRVAFDWKDYYPKTLQRKFAWIDTDPELIEGS
jgi:DNA topoisomerase-1